MSSSFLSAADERTSDTPVHPRRLLALLPPPTIPSCSALCYALMAYCCKSDWAAYKFLLTYNADTMADVGLVAKSFTLPNGWVCKYWIRAGKPSSSGGPPPPAIFVLPGFREKVYPAARLAQTIGMEEATIYVVDIPTCGGHCLPGLPDPVPSGAFSELPVKIPNACKLVKALIDHLQPSSLVLLGFSTGGHLAYTLANEHGSELPLKGIGLIHPAGDCLSDKLLDIIGSGSMKEWPFDWEEVRVKEDICTETRLCSNIAPSSCVTDSGCSLLTHFSLRRPIARCCITTGAAA